jgi:16S rRNA (cytidine1402-2'-O)-methyltransferase
VARELTKIHEEFVRGSAGDVAAEFKKRPSIKGEITVVVSFK